MVREAVDMLEEFVNQAAEPLEQAGIVAIEARNIANLPQHIDQHLIRLIMDIERIDSIRTTIAAVRQDLLSRNIAAGEQRLLASLARARA
jgi:hypothetical protein